ncbi:double-strand break repair protein MRE11 [Teleopsis dalmanni]|uniref:double-strand break repair protein MRE11 n=1 Tax=Teleopsis dalmanni TaxID=139649 RepID=UPI0018CF5AE2|nr:double-strand break repair protein MRE11 [Teleopsis dalmanni]
MENGDEIDAKDLLRIMISTDNHLGYAEKDPVRGEDSFNAFEEMLEIAVEENVDFILLGGDLFHDAVPSQNSLHKCMKLLRRYTFGDKPVELEFLSDQTTNFHNAVNDTVNYEDPNLNISIPVFSIHGNHDDPSGFGCLSSLDLLSTMGLVNYFGRWTDLSKIDLTPILLKKGETRLALYGLSHIHDARLVRLFQGLSTNINQPSDEEGEWFNLFVLHQNRYDRGPKNFVPEEILPDFFDLIIWGHEHDCRLQPEHNVKKDFFVSQPGSSVPTSLAEGEAKKKHVGILTVYKKNFKMKPIALESVRPFIFESVNLNKLTEELLLDECDASNKVKNFAEQRVLEMIERAKEMLTGHPKQPTLPLLRLRLEFSEEEQMFNAIRLGQNFNEQVANPADIITFKKMMKRVKGEAGQCDKEAMKNAFEEMDIDVGTRVEDLVDRYFEEVKDTKTLRLISSKIFSEMCFRLVERRDVNAAESIINYYKENVVAHLMDKLPTEENIQEEISNFRDKVELDDVLKMLDSRSAKANIPATTAKGGAKSSKNNMDKDFLFSEQHKVDSDFDSTTSTRGRGRGKRVARGGGTRGKNSMPPLNISVGVNDSFTSAAVPRTRESSRGGRGSRGGRTRAKNTMQPASASVGRTRSSERQQSLLDALKSAKTSKHVMVIDDSDVDSD